MRTRTAALILAVLVSTGLVSCVPQAGEATQIDSPGASSVPANSVLTATTAPSGEPAGSETAVPSGPTPTPAPTNTIPPSLTPPPSAPPTLEPTPTPEPSPTPLPNQPGYYHVGQCVTYHLPKDQYDVTFCVLYAVIQHNGNIVFTVNWTAHLPENKRIGKRSDTNNRKMYLMDDLGNRYDHIAVGGSAAEYVYMYDGDVVTGTFEFPRAARGATVFAFHDQDQDVEITGIRFDNPVVLSEAQELQWSPGSIEYLIEQWEQFETEDGSYAWAHLDIAGCQVIEVPPGELEGSYKNTIELGDLTYEIYGWAATDWFVREYVLVAGIPDVALDPAPKFHMLIPFDHSLQCIFDASLILGSYWIPEG